MNAVDATDRTEKQDEAEGPSLLTIILDTNPHAWALLADSLPLSKAWRTCSSSSTRTWQSITPIESPFLPAMQREQNGCILHLRDLAKRMVS